MLRQDAAILCDAALQVRHDVSETHQVLPLAVLPVNVEWSDRQAAAYAVSASVCPVSCMLPSLQAPAAL
jgi:hypothetical protein